MKDAVFDASGWHTPVPRGHPAAALLSAAAVRARCEAVTRHVEAGASPHFLWHEDRLGEAAEYVIGTLRARYPDLQVPYHSRWRHFEAQGVDRWMQLRRDAGLDDPHERARVRVDLVIPSVLLDAGAGPDWRYHDVAHDQWLARSEGLGVASLRLFERGAFSSHPHRPLRSDALALARLDERVLAEGFQVRHGNRLVGVPGRLALLRRLGQVAQATPTVFGSPARLGHLVDFLLAHAPARRVEASFVLETLLRALGPVWPAGGQWQGVPLGDCWRHDATPDGWAPFHKLTQWLTYSLLEPLEDAGLQVTGLGALTGLPEYRNGGLVLDLGLLVPRDRSFFTRPLELGEPAVVEWRAVTVVALDRIARGVRERLGLDEAAFPLARVLEGGTWAAGRRIAAERRAGGPPPVQLVSDGTVF